MGTVARIKTPQFQTDLVRKLRNLFPDCETEFQQADRGITFRLRDRQGRYRSNRVSVYRYHERVLDRANLKRAIRQAGSPPAGFPRDL